MRILRNPEKINNDITYGIIESGEGSKKLSSDFRYVFEDRLKLGDAVCFDTVGAVSGESGSEYDMYICCAYDHEDAVRSLSAKGFVYGKDFLFAEDFFCLLDDWKNSEIAYKAHSGDLIGCLKAIMFGYAAKHGIVLPEDPHRDILTEKHLPANNSHAVQRFFHALYMIPALIEAFPRIFANRKDYGDYDHICFYSVSDAVKFRNDHTELAYKVITVEELKAHTMASLYMKAVYSDRRQNSCSCDVPFNTLWIGRNGTTRLCDCPDFLDISLGNIGVTGTSEVWNSTLAKIIRLSVINNTYTFCSRNLCGKLSGDKEQTLLLERRAVSEYDHPLNINVANDYVCNLHCPSCRKCIHAKNDENEETEIRCCIDSLFESGWLEKADKLLVGGGGEAFLSGNYKRVIYGGSEKRNSITIMTNGTLFTEEEWEKLQGKYESISFMVSVDAAGKETYEKVRCGGSFERLMKNMDFLSELRRLNKVDSVKVIMIVQKANYTEIPAFIRWAKDKGFDGVSLSHIRNWGTYDDRDFYENVSMFDMSGNMKPELAEVLADPVCMDPMVNTSWKAQ
ncbi:MAG: SPASM domain-containing protein [Lachnospiraceae bacterium]|nr:SPASM domain-containing protein [Lachnospiraceae bacterium]